MMMLDGHVLIIIIVIYYYNHNLWWFYTGWARDVTVNNEYLIVNNYNDNIFSLYVKREDFADGDVDDYELLTEECVGSNASLIYITLVIDRINNKITIGFEGGSVTTPVCALLLIFSYPVS